MSTKSTLGKLKNHLPIEVKSKKDQSFTFIDWGMDEEKIVSRLKEKNPSMGRFISRVLVEMVETLHGEDFRTLDKKERNLIINQLPMGSVLYMYLYLRYDQLDEEISLNFDCPYCQSGATNIIANLEDMDVDTKVGDYDELLEYKLKKPITLDEGKQLIDTLHIEIGKWDIMESADRLSNQDEATMKEHTYRRSLVVKGDNPVSIDKVLKKLRKKDIEKISGKISEHNAGPSVTAEVKCPKCDREHTHTIDWRYESFFGVGSLPQA